MLISAQKQDRGPMFTVVEQVTAPVEGSIGGARVIAEAGSQIPLSQAIALGLAEAPQTGEGDSGSGTPDAGAGSSAEAGA